MSELRIEDECNGSSLTTGWILLLFICKRWEQLSSSNFIIEVSEQLNEYIWRCV